MNNKILLPWGIPAQLSDIATIAHQCPYVGGDAVYAARAINALYTDAVYNDTDICGAIGIQARQIKTEETTPIVPTLKIYPNPVINELTISIADKKDITSSISIIDVYGRVLHQEETNNNILSISTHHWAAGIYYIRVSNGTKIIANQSFIKVH